MIINIGRRSTQPVCVGYAASFFDRLRGLMFRSTLSVDDGILLDQQRDSVIDSSIHMMFVPFDLAVIWIDSALTVVDVQRARSWHPAYWSKKPARYVLELHVSRIKDFQTGDKVQFNEIPG